MTILERQQARMRKRVYICAPLGGDVTENLERAIQYTEYALKAGVAPVTTHFYALCLDDNNPKERALGMSAGMSLLWDCQELWIFGDKITAGMKEEIDFCKNLNIKIKKISNVEIKKVLGGHACDNEHKKEILENFSSTNAPVSVDADRVSVVTDRGMRFG